MNRKREQDAFFHGRRSARWARMIINGLTCFGAGISMVAMLVAFDGNYRLAWLLLAFGVVIDGMDGTLIRTFGLKDHCPNFDGDRLDEYADLLTFVIAPAGVTWGLATLLAVVAGSVLQFSYRRAKTSRAFWGFPSYWNIIYFYGWALNPSPETMMVLSWGLVVGLFVPIPFVYPSRTHYCRIPTNLLALAWGASLVAYLCYPQLPIDIIHWSLLFPAYYVLISIYVALRSP